MIQRRKKEVHRTNLQSLSTSNLNTILRQTLTLIEHALHLKGRPETLNQTHKINITFVFLIGSHL